MSWRLLRTRPALVTLALVASGIAYEAWAFVDGARKLTTEEIAAARTGAFGRLDLRVVLPFAPEQFHFIWLQNFGRMAGADATSVALRGVAEADARHLARQYWIRDLEPLGAR